jgi:glycosyltransferase A (GT-A) superfamily protein (DUF2064 family)
MSLLDGTPLAHPDNRHLILFARYPTPGAAKTRLIAQLGAVGAAQLAKRLTEHTLKQAERLGCSGFCRLAGCGFYATKRG